MTRSVAARQPILRVWDELRHFHLAIAAETSTDLLLYRRRNYDLRELPPTLAFTAKRAGVLRTSFCLLTKRYSFIEINEPGHFMTWPYLFFYACALRARRAIFRAPCTVGFYAIENSDGLDIFARATRLPRPLSAAIYRRVLSWIIGTCDRVCFGTDGAAEMYRRYAGRVLENRVTLTVPPLPAECNCPAQSERSGVLFVGSFESRKGLALLMAGWDELLSRGPAPALTMIGTGPLLDEVVAWATGKDSVEVVLDPPKEAIHAAYRAATVVVLLSQRARFWREQIGLPILEALSHGCRVVATDETGIAGWLRANGHTVVAAQATAATVASALDSACSHEIPVDARHPLPMVSGRVLAGRWLTAGSLNDGVA